MPMLAQPPIAMTRRIDTPVKVEHYLNGGSFHTVIFIRAKR
ncbi:hypothetical protein OT109_04315 [Phycisphaeraceae bacterium D3-23]